MQSIRGDIRDEINGVAVVSGTLSTVVLGPYNLLTSRDKSFAFYNLGPLTLSGVVIQVNPDPQGNESGQVLSNPFAQNPAAPNPGLWTTIDSTTFRTIAAGEVRAGTITATCYKWWRAVATTDQPNGNVTVSGYLYARTI